MRARSFSQDGWKVIGMAMLLGAMNTSAQIPDYFGQQQMWTIYQSASCANVQCYCVWESTLYVDQDTMIGPSMYKRMGKRGIQYEGAIGVPDPMNPCNSQVLQFDGTYACLRQSNDSVFAVFPYRQGEVLFVSYDLQVGDALGPYCPGCVVDSVDTTIMNGDAHRRFHTSAPGGPGMLIEGIVNIRNFGSVPLGGEFDWVFGPNEVVCFAENGSTVWTNPNWSGGGCNYFMDLGVGNLPDNTLSVTVHPNPANEVITIAVADPVQYTVTLRDISGKQLFHELNAVRIDVGQLSAGTYLIEVRDLKDQHVFRDKVVVAR
jgi:hypothetical protein